MHNKCVKILLACVLLCSMFLSLTACKQNTATVEEIYALDTVISITAYGASSDVFDNAKDEIKRLEALLSATNPESDISRINNSENEFVKVSDECYFLLKTALEVSSKTNGRFDVSIYPAVKLWGFADDNYKVPTESELEETSALIDYRFIELNDSEQSVRIPEGCSIDLGAIAKGYIADKAAQVFEQSGVTSALLNFGGNIRLIGSKPDGSDWNIGVKAPFSTGYFATVKLSNQTASTAGGYERYFEENGKTYHHILNPDTAAPSDSDVLSATVVGAKGELCDALATSAFVSGSKGIGEFASSYPDYCFILLTESAVYVSENIAEDISLTQAYSDFDIITI